MKTRLVSPNSGAVVEIDFRTKKRVSKEPNNRWNSSDSPSFVQWPSFWRTFVHHVLTPRDLTVYLYVTSHIRTDGAISFVYVRAIRDGLGLRTDDLVRKSLRRLVDLGFLLRFDVENRTLRQAYMKVAFQRPRVHHTIVRLLELQLIDERFRPRHADGYDRDSIANDPTFEPSLKRLFHNSYAFGLHGRYEHVLKHLSTSQLLEEYGPTTLSIFLNAVLMVTAKRPDPEMGMRARYGLVRSFIVGGLDAADVPVPSNLWDTGRQRNVERAIDQNDLRAENARNLKVIRAFEDDARLRLVRALARSLSAKTGAE